MPTSRLAQVSITLNQRTYRFDCGENDVERLEDIAAHLKHTFDRILTDHGMIGDERLVLLAAITIADEMFDLRRDLEMATAPDDERRDDSPARRERTVA